jgi:PelA/Pel-15E family pectate lyase
MMQRLLFFAVLIVAVSASSGFADITVAADGSGDVRSVQQAIEKVPDGNRSRVIIRLKPGVYREQVRVPATKPYITILGKDAATTLITYSLSNRETGSTSASFSTYIGGHDFRAENVTFENSFGKGSQAVAVLVEGDRAVFRNCRFLGWQDTLYAKGARQYYKNCYIEGTVDFIFGQAAAVFDSCEIHSKGDGYIAAPMRFAAYEPSGLIFYKCKLTASDVKEGVYLGRPWRDYGRTVYLDTRMQSHIRPEGWHRWEPQREKTAFLGEYHSKGEGAGIASRVSWARKISETEARSFRPENFLKGDDGWKPGRSPDSWVEGNPPVQKAVTWTAVLKQSPLWYQTDEAARIADQVLIYQKENGGWEKNVDMAAMLTVGERTAITAKKSDISETTIDNRTSYTQVNYLAKVITASLLKASPPANLAKYKEGFNKGLDHLFEYQYSNGGYPQYFPLKKGYYTHITLNDDAMVGVLHLMRDVASSHSDYKFVDDVRRQRAKAAVEKGIALLLKLQVDVNGKKTIWAQQYDETSLKPAWARKFEPPSLATSESVGVVRFLMGEKPAPEIAAAIESAVQWFRANPVRGIRWERVKGENTVIKEANAPAIWARFYEIETMKPIFLGRDSVIRYDVMQIEAERRNGYAWFIESPNELLDSAYPKWKGTTR